MLRTANAAHLLVLGRRGAPASSESLQQWYRTHSAQGKQDTRSMAAITGSGPNSQDPLMFSSGRNSSRQWRHWRTAAPADGRVSTFPVEVPFFLIGNGNAEGGSIAGFLPLPCNCKMMISKQKRKYTVLFYTNEQTYKNGCPSKSKWKC